MPVILPRQKDINLHSHSLVLRQLQVIAGIWGMSWAVGGTSLSFCRFASQALELCAHM